MEKKEPSYTVGGGLLAKSCLTHATPWTISCQTPLFMGFPGQEYWSGFPFPSPGDLPDPGIKPTFVTCTTLLSYIGRDTLPTEPLGKPHCFLNWCKLV